MYAKAYVWQDPLRERVSSPEYRVSGDAWISRPDASDLTRPFNPGNPPGWGQASFGMLNVSDPVHQLRCLSAVPNRQPLTANTSRLRRVGRDDRPGHPRARGPRAPTFRTHSSLALTSVLITPFSPAIRHLRLPPATRKFRLHLCTFAQELRSDLHLCTCASLCHLPAIRHLRLPPATRK
jgi:hypothetical protein